MATPASGAISLGNVNQELTRAGTSPISMDDASLRKLFQVGAAGTSISMSSGYNKTKQGAIYAPSCVFNNLGGSGRLYVAVDYCPAFAAIYFQLYATTSGNALGTSQYFGTCDANGSYYGYATISGSDSYWFPASKTNWFSVLQDNVYNIGGFAASS